jgi:Ni,Fe-hydrogenase III large subunit
MTSRRIDGIKYNLEKMTDEELKHLLSNLTKRMIQITNDMTEVRIVQRKRKFGDV